jgi:hypothetical protein
MSMDVDRFYLIVSIRIRKAVELSICNGVAGCVCPNSVRMTLNGAPLCVYFESMPLLLILLLTQLLIINVFYFNCAFADPIGSNLNKQKGSHNGLLKELGGRLVSQYQTAAQGMSPIPG